jgi:site-specific recombinase XerD
VLTTPDVAPSAEWLHAWLGFELREISANRSASSIGNRKSNVLIMARHMTAAGIIDPVHCDASVMQPYLARQYADRRPGGRVTLYTDLHVFWKWFAEAYGTDNPLARIPRPKGARTEVPVIRPEQLDDILKACKDRTEWGTLRNVAMVWLMIESGLRRFEVTALDLADVDLKARTVTVRSGKGAKARVAVFGDETGQALWRYLRHRGREDGPLFVSEHGGRLTASGLTQVVTRIKRRSGVTVRPHMFRHSWAHYSLDSGIQETNLMQLAGWESLTMLRIYGRKLAQDRAIEAGRRVQVGKILKGRRS